MIYIKYIDKQDYLGYLFYSLSDTKNLFILRDRNFEDKALKIYYINSCEIP